MTRRRFRVRRAPPPPAELTAALLENLSDPVLACDAQGTIVMSNRRAREVLGATADPVPAERWTERCPIYRPDGSRIERTEDLPLAHALRGEDVRDMELEVRPNGSRHVMQVSGSPVRGATGEITGAVIVMHEVTDRVTADESLGLQSAIAANIAEGLALIRASDGVIVYVNEAWEEMFGYEYGELLGRHISVVNGPTEQTPEDRAQEMTQALESEGAWSGEVNHVRKDGSRLWCAVTVSTFEHPEHGTVWISANTDITEHKAAEDALRVAEERFRTVFDEGPVGILVVDNELRMTDVNQAFSDITGYRHDELVGTLCTAISHPDDLELETELATRLATGEIPRYRINKRFLSKEGGLVAVAQTTTLVRDPDGEPLYRVAIVEELGRGT